MAEQNEKEITLKIKRQDGPDEKPYWEWFKVPYRKNLNVITCLMEIQRNPVDIGGKPVRPVVWDSNCLEEVCGACTMLVNGKVCQSCAALIDRLEQPVVLEPMTKFPVVRDLIVDRSKMFEGLKRINGWVPIDGTYDLGPGPRESQQQQQIRYALARCMTCGCCLEVCPQINEHSDFIGPAAIAQVDLFNTHPTGALNKGERLDAMTDHGGVAACGNAQNCVRVCPKEIPLTDSIARVNRSVNTHFLKNLLSL